MYVIVSLLGLPREEYWILDIGLVSHRIVSHSLAFLVIPDSSSCPGAELPLYLLDFAHHFVYTSCR